MMKCVRKKRRLKREIDRKLSQLGLTKRSMTVAVLGTVGVGKSSFINSIATAMFSSPWSEHAITGHHAGKADPVTGFTKRYRQCCRPHEHKNVNMPTILDIGGLPDKLDNVWQEVINMVLYGRVPEGTNLLDVYDYIKARDEVELHFPPRYWKINPHLVVDRVVVVGAATEDVPVNLLETVHRAAMPIQGPSNRSIPVFGVNTKIDHVDVEVDEEFHRREKVFKDILGLRGAGNRYLRCINYCSDIDPDDNRILTNYPSLDVPILRLMTQICDPAIEVVNTDQLYPFHYLLKERSVTMLIAICFAIIAFLIPSVFLLFYR